MHYSHRMKKVLSKSMVCDYLVGRKIDRGVECMAVSETGAYAFVVESSNMFNRNAAIHVFKVHWSRLLQKIHIFRFSDESTLKPLRGLISFRWISKRFQILFGFTSEKKSTLVTFCFDKKKKYIFSAELPQKRGQFNLPNQSRDCESKGI